jgi:hypothetical protein
MDPRTTSMDFANAEISLAFGATYKPHATNAVNRNPRNTRPPVLFAVVPELRSSKESIW